MAYKDLHIEPFDEGTITKLEIFEDYAEAWIPTFVMQQIYKEIHIFDFFAGPGYDNNNISGSPIRLLQTVKKHIGNIIQKNVKVVLHFNEFEPSKKEQNKFDLLQKACNEFLETNKDVNRVVEVYYYNKDSEILFFELLGLIKTHPSLVYLDQNGVKFISNKFLLELEKLEKTDFIYFVSSSYFWRFGDTPEFKQLFDFDVEKAKKDPYRFIHRKLLDELKSKLPISTKLKLYPFSLRKESNIFGIIFGAKNLRGVDKFLDIAWKRNCINGEADFDINEDDNKQQLDLFEGKKLTKVEKFQQDLEFLILNNTLKNNKEVLIYTYENGHIPKHSSLVLSKLKIIDKKLNYDSKTPAVNYDNVFKKKKIVYYILKK